MNAIAPYRPAVPARRDPHVVQFAAGGVAADVRVDRDENSAHSYWYALRLASTESEVSGRLIGVSRSGNTVDLGGVAVAPGSVGSARLSVPMPRAGGYGALYLEIRSEHVLLRVEAPQPPAQRRHRALKAGAACVAVGALAVCGGMAALALPRDPVLASPGRAHAGAEVHLPYAAPGYGAIDYVATMDDGALLAAGPLAAARGEIAFMLPRSAADHRVSVNVRLRGPLGTVSRNASFTVAQPEPTSVATGLARVGSLSARRDAGLGGETILASYLAVAERGTVALLDAAGRVIASAPLAHVGTTRIAVPSAFRNLPLTAQITAHRGATSAVASVVVPPSAPVESPAPEAAQLADVPEAVTPIDSTSSHASGGMVAVEGRAIAGKPLMLRVVANPSPMQLELQDDTGGTLAEARIAPGTTHAVLPLPSAETRTTYFIALHYAHNGGEETVVRTVTASLR